MQTVAEWFPDWIAEHLDRHPWSGLPGPMDDGAETLYGAWQEAFAREGIAEPDATEASKRLVAVDVFPGQHFVKLLELARALSAGRGLKVAESPEDTARRKSRGCPECDGQGVAVRFRHHSRPLGAPVYLHCVCLLGRHLKAEGRSFGGSPCLDLAAYPRLQGEDGDRYRLPPSPSPPARDLAVSGLARKEFWWRTGHPVPNSPET